jgi:hypothetical protein
MALDGAVAADRKLHRGGAAGRQAAEQVAGVGARGHFVDQLGDVGRAGVGMDQRGVGLEAQAQRRHAGEHAVLVGGRSHSITASAGSSKYSALFTARPTPTVPAQSVTSGSSAARASRMSRASTRSGR